jgi:hypothetical protein
MDTVTYWYMAKGPRFVGTVYNSMVSFGSKAKRPIPHSLLEPQGSVSHNHRVTTTGHAG